MVTPLATALILGVTVFVATNIDDVFLLLALFANPAYRLKDIFLGQYLGIGALVAFSLIAALIALVIPMEYVGLLGLLPIALGVKELIESWRGEDDDEDHTRSKSRSAGTRVLAVAAITMANGGDNIAVYTPVFAIRSAYEIVTIVLVFAVMTAVICVAAYWLVNHRALGAPIRQYGQRVLPFVLIALGVWILYEAGTIALVSK